MALYAGGRPQVEDQGVRPAPHRNALPHANRRGLVRLRANRPPPPRAGAPARRSHEPRRAATGDGRLYDFTPNRSATRYFASTPIKSLNSVNVISRSYAPAVV